MKIELADRIRELPPYLFASIEAIKRKHECRPGSDIIDLSVGDPDLPTHEHIVHALEEAVRDPRNHRYPSQDGTSAMRASVAAFMSRRFGVSVDALTQVICSIGSKEAIAHFPFAFVNPGDIVLCPSPGYPVFARGTQLAGGEPHFFQLERARAFLPDLAEIPSDIARRAKVMWLNYPNNPTGAVATARFYREVVAFARHYDIIVASDAAYCEIYYGTPPISFLQTTGALEVGIEFHSLSKSYNMAGWRVGWACGNKQLVEGLSRVKANIDSGCFDAIQAAAIAALNSDQALLERQRETYRARRDLLCLGLRKAGLEVITPEATFYSLISNPRGSSSLAFATKLLTEAGVLVTPATGFGDAGEGYVRATFCAPAERLLEAVRRIELAV